VVNAYGSRADAIGLFVGLGAFLLVLGVLVLGSVSRIPPRLINVPHRDYWAEPSRLPTLRRMLAWDIAVLFGLPLLALSVLPVDLTLTTLDPAGHGQAAFLVAIGALVVGIAGYTVWMATVRYRPS
jgi:hypothetical protein